MRRPSPIGLFIAIVITGWSAAPAIGAWSDDPTVNLPVRVIDGYQQVSSSSSVSDGAGGVYVVWRDRRFIAVTDRDLLAQRLGPNGDEFWGIEDLPIVVEDDSQTNCDLLSAGTGGLFVAWSDSRTGTPDIYAQHISSGGAISGPANGLEVCTNTEWQAGPTIVGGTGGIIVAWNDYRNTATATDIYAHKVFDDVIFDDGFETGEWDAVFP